MMILPVGCTVVFREDGSHGQIDVDPGSLATICSGSLSSGAVHDLAVGGDDSW